MTKFNILLADNDRGYRDSLTHLLELEGYHVDVVASVVEAYERLQNLPLDLVLADLRLGDETNTQDISGLDVAKEAVKRQIPCIIITAFDTVETARLALISLGVNSLAVDYVTKKDGPKAILNSIHRLYGITLLHISDLHPKFSEDGEVPFDQEQAYEEFIDDVVNQSGLALNPIQAILVSGDISFQSKSESFDWSRRYLTNLARQLDISVGHIILAPGNHDINRKNAQLTSDTLQAMRDNNRAWFSKFDRFLDFAHYFYGEPAFSPEKLYRIFTFDNRVAIVAFNSCLVEGDSKWRCKTCAENSGKEHYRGWIDRYQVKQASDELDRQNLTGLRIGMFHHHVVSEDWYSPSDGCQGDHLWTYHHNDHRLKFTFFERGFRILLHGHRHKVELRQSQTVGAKESYNFGSGAFWRSENNQDETANYLLLQLSALPNRSRVIMRKYSPATNDRPGYWGVDDSIQTNGIIPLPSIVIPPLRASPDAS